jgi:hypothetical protein
MRNRLKITDRRIGPNHSWRHRFETVHRRLRTRQAIVDAIMGHEGSAGQGSIGRHYGEYEVAVCRAEIERMPRFCDCKVCVILPADHPNQSSALVGVNGS